MGFHWTDAWNNVLGETEGDRKKQGQPWGWNLCGNQILSWGLLVLFLIGASLVVLKRQNNYFLLLSYAGRLFRMMTAILESTRWMRGPCGVACAGLYLALVPLLYKYSACHQWILDTLYVGPHAATPIILANNNNFALITLALVEKWSDPPLGSSETGEYCCIWGAAEQTGAMLCCLPRDAGIHRDKSDQ